MIKDINILATSESYMYFSEKKTLGYELCETWISFWIMYTPITLILNVLVKGNGLIYKGFFLLIPFLAITLIERYIKNSMKYLIANLVVTLIIFAISFTLVEKIFFCGLIIIFFIFSVQKRRKETVDFYGINLLVFSEVFIAALYIIALANNFENITTLITLIAVNLAISFAIYIHLSRNLKLLEWEGGASNQYTKSRKKLMLLCVIFIAGILLLLFSLAWFFGVLEFFDIFTRKIIGFFSAEHISKAVPKAIEKPPIDSMNNMENAFKPLGGSGKENMVITFIIKVVEFMGKIVIFVFAAYLLKLIIQAVLRFYYSLNNKGAHGETEREQIFSLVEIKKEFKEKTEKFIRKIENPFDLSNSKKIRRLYLKQIKRFKAEGVQTEVNNTPVEIENSINKILQKDIMEITVVYEKARYSSQECTKEDVEKLKKFKEC